MLQLIEGTSGSGKSRLIYEEMIQASIQNPKEKFFLIVPEQSTMQAQREVVALHPKHGTMNIDIVSFNRLAYRVFEEQNIRCENVLEDFGKSMLLQRILMEHRQELPAFGPCAKKPGFLDELKSLLTELFQYRIGREDILQAYQELPEGTILKNKLHDLLFIFDVFQEEIEGRYIIAEHILEMLAMHVSESALLKKSRVYLDGYTGFTPIQYEVLEALAKVCTSLTVTVTIDKKSAVAPACEEHTLFYMSKDTIQRLYKMAARIRIPVDERFLEGEAPRFRNRKELLHLEENLFRYPYQSWKGEARQIHIQAMSNPRQELRMIARQIRSMVRSKNYRYQDFAVIHGNLEELEPLVEEVFSGLNIPCFMDSNRSIYMNPCLESIQALLAITLQDYSYESVFRFLKTGVTGMDTDMLEQLENYVLRNGIRGYKLWQKIFIEKGSKENVPESVLLCGTKVTKLLGFFTESLLQAETVQEYVAVLNGFLERLKMQEQLEEAGIAFGKNGNLVQEKAYRQIYAKISDIMEKLVTILGEEEMSLDDFQAILKAGFDHISLGVIPPSLDQVTIGDIERTRIDHVKILFIAGVNDGIIPHITKGGGILSEADRSCLRQRLELAPDSKSRVFTEQFYLYQNVTKPSEELYLTYHVQDDEGNETLPAYLIGRLLKLFPALTVEELKERKAELDRVETPEDSKAVMTDFLQIQMQADEKRVWKGLYQYYQAKDPHFLEQIHQGLLYNNIERYLSKETARLLYGDCLNTSVTRLEAYSRCPYQFFLEYGLGLRKRERKEITLGDMGTLLHHVMERVFSQVENRNPETILLSEETENNWTNISDEELYELVVNEVRKAEEQEDSIYQYSYANKQQLNRIQKIAAYAVVDLKQQLLQGKMIPYQFELSFNRKDSDAVCEGLTAADISLESGEQIHLSGVIDRIDICQDAERVYVKVMDYKSSKKEMEAIHISAGLQLQLLVYTNVVIEILKKRFPDKEIVPAGSLYYGFSLPMVEKTGKKESAGLIRKIQRQTALTGLVNREDPCPWLLGNAELLPIKQQEIEGIPTIQESETALTGEEYQTLLNEVRKTVGVIGKEMLDGQIPIRPVRVGKGLPCDYCDYQEVCKLDCRDGGNRICTVKQLREVQKGGRSGGMDKGTESSH